MQASERRFLKKAVPLGLALVFGTLMLPAFIGLNSVFNPKQFHLSGAAFGAARIAHVAAESGLVFPVGTVGLDYWYIHSQDPSGCARLELPAHAVARFVSGPAFHNPDQFRSVQLTNPGLPWWRPAQLRQTREGGLERGSCFMGCLVGEENGRWIVYVHWFHV